MPGAGGSAAPLTESNPTMESEPLRLRGVVRAFDRVNLLLMYLGMAVAVLVFGNIVGNAVKFTPDGGAVTLTVRRTENGTLLFRVADNGVGIPKEDIPRILKPFEQSSAPTPSRGRDTCLGLALTSKFAGLHDARTDIDSAVGVGTAVTVTFPPARVRMPEPEEPATGSAA